MNKKPSCHSVARLSSQRSSEVPYFPISFMRVHCASLKKPNRDECSEMNIKCKKLCPSPNCLKTTLTAVSWFLLPGLSSCYIYGDEAVKPRHGHPYVFRLLIMAWKVLMGFVLPGKVVGFF